MRKDRGPDQTRPLDDPAVFQRIGRAIQVLRAELGLSRKELASRASISYSYLSEIEGGKKELSSKTMFVLADALGVSPSELMAAAETRVRSSAAAPREEQPFSGSRSMMDVAMPAPAASMESAEPDDLPESPSHESWFRRREPALRGRRRSDDAERDREELIGILNRLDPEDRALVMEFARRLVR